MGHIAWFCRGRHGKASYSGSQSASEENGDEPTSYHGVMLGATNVSEVTVNYRVSRFPFILDSDATDRMAHKTELLSNSEPLVVSGMVPTMYGYNQ